jgi:hypothetical protein
MRLAATTGRKYLSLGKAHCLPPSFMVHFARLPLRFSGFSFPKHSMTIRKYWHSPALLLLFAAVFQISDSTQAIGAGLLRGIKDVKTPTILIGIAYWVIGIPFGYVLAFHFNMGASGMWLGTDHGPYMASIFLMTRFFKMSKRNRV